MFEYLTDQRGFQSSPTELMRAAAEKRGGLLGGGFDAAILVKRYGIPLFPDYLLYAILHEDLGRLRFALSQGQVVSDPCYEALIASSDAALLNEVLLARKAGGRIPEADLLCIKRAVHRAECHQNVQKVLADHSIFAWSGIRPGVASWDEY